MARSNILFSPLPGFRSCDHCLSVQISCQSVDRWFIRPPVFDRGLRTPNIPLFSTADFESIGRHIVNRPVDSFITAPWPADGPTLRGTGRLADRLTLIGADWHTFPARQPKRTPAEYQRLATTEPERPFPTLRCTCAAILNKCASHNGKPIVCPIQHLHSISLSGFGSQLPFPHSSGICAPSFYPRNHSV